MGYIHFADSNRKIFGTGHIDFLDIMNNLKWVNYTGWISVEILPYPSAYIAAKEAINYIKPIIYNYNLNEAIV